jgi:hypothetical protein
MRQKKLADIREGTLARLHDFFNPGRAAFAVQQWLLAPLTGVGKDFGTREEQDDEALWMLVAENLEFFQNMEVLDAMDFLESNSTTKGTT